MTEPDEAQEPQVKKGKKDRATKPLPSTPDEIEALIRRQKRNQRKAWAEGYMTAITAMLRAGDLVMDCGANMGVVTELLAATGADVLAYEPDPYAFSILEEKFVNTPNVTLINAAVGVGAGTIRLMRADNFGDNPDGASVKSTIMDGGRRIDAENAVEVTLLDFPTLVREHVAARGEIAFIKMDIEGAELEILETLDRDDLFTNIRALVVETHERKFKDLRERYKALRETVAAKYPAGKVNLDWI
ncbi:FkbM family methyltransferase [Cypionkella sp.]|uniref:FkbM family methyltransferase n=1 Tax=Cypionkella sp. TaxID=2811411 RepID=UPI002AB966D4|nr:FkbM family methyltransferase [Cypionkella sp.]MDZ4395128.1 FkbM family methyltransferase [Cypionkella sp.]